VSSVRRGNRHIVAVVLGGSSGAARDARMRGLIEQHIASASSRRTVAKIVEATDLAVAKAAAPAPAKIAEPALARPDAMAPVSVASAPLRTPEAASPAPEQGSSAPQPAPALSRAPKPGSGEPINPVKVKTITVKAGNVQSAVLVPLVAPAPQATVAPAHFAPAAAASAPLPPPGARPGVLGVLPAEPRTTVYQTAAASTAPVTTESTRPAHPRGPWIIQVGAFPKEAEAKDRLREAQTLAKSLLAKADPFTEKVMKGNQELYRARFAGLNQSAAEAACKYFKRNDIACMAIRN
jgi:D-alanyl-D-alanine carboxypeptidase